MRKDREEPPSALDHTLVRMIMEGRKLGRGAKGSRARKAYGQHWYHTFRLAYTTGNRIHEERFYKKGKK